MIHIEAEALVSEYNSNLIKMGELIKEYVDRLSHDKERSNQFLKYLHSLAGIYIRFDIIACKKVKKKIFKFLNESKNEDEDNVIIADFIIESYTLKKTDEKSKDIEIQTRNKYKKIQTTINLPISVSTIESTISSTTTTTTIPTIGKTTSIISTSSISSRDETKTSTLQNIQDYQVD